MSNFFNYKDIKNSTMTKQEMYFSLSGKNVKCIYIENEGIGLFYLQDTKNKKLYLLDNINI